MSQLRFIVTDKDRHGNERVYFRRNGSKVRIRETIGSPEFDSRYAALVADSPSLRSRENKSPAIKRKWDPRGDKDQKQHVRLSSATGFVYFLVAGTRVKIGFSTSPSARVKQLKTGIGHKIDAFMYVRGTALDEKKLHHLLKAFRREGEWFEHTLTVKRVVVRAIMYGLPLAEFGASDADDLGAEP